jgi:hypothetical protein
LPFLMAGTDERIKVNVRPSYPARLDYNPRLPWVQGKLLVHKRGSISSRTRKFAMRYVRVEEEVVASPTLRRATTVERVSITLMIPTLNPMKINRTTKAHRPEIRSPLTIQHRLKLKGGTCRLMSLLEAHYNGMPTGPLWSQES